MQRSRQRLMSSKASASSPSDITLRSRRKSRTSSAGGDGFAVDKDLKKFGNDVESKIRSRSAKCNMRLLPARERGSKKTGRSVKSLRPSFGSLQNTIVLAPFYTLKKCFQNKLIDLYSGEKLKKMNHRMKMAERPNTSFEYDVVKLRAVEQKPVKKVAKNPMIFKSRGNQKEVAEKRKSQSYCQCDKKRSRSEIRLPHDSRARKFVGRNSRGKREALNTENRHTLMFSTPFETQQRKFGRSFLVPSTLKNEFRPRLEFLSDCLGSAGRSDTNLSFSAGSSQSKMESWETFSDSPSYREERLEGSLAISTTSFDSCLEQCEDACDMSGGRGSRMRSKYKSGLTMVKELAAGAGCEDNVGRAADLIPRPKKNDSRHLIAGAGTNISDGRISDFMDREPQSHLLSAETPQHVQPLRRPSRSKTKKQSETESSAVYYLRSANRNREDLQCRHDDEDLQGQSGPKVDADKIFWKKSKVETHTEVGTQFEEMNSPEERRDSAAAPPISVGRCGSHLAAMQGPEGVSKESLPSDTNGCRILKAKDISKNGSQKIEYEANSDAQNELLHQNKNLCTLFEKVESQSNESKDKEQEQEQELNKIGNSDKSAWGDESLEPRALPDAPPSALALQNSENWYQGSGNPERQPQQPQDKESDFIFGVRNSSTHRHGESCEFSFGLNWKISDEEDSDHGNHFF